MLLRDEKWLDELYERLLGKEPEPLYKTLTPAKLKLDPEIFFEGEWHTEPPDEEKIKEPFEHLTAEVGDYYISTNNTFDHGLETMIFKMDESGAIDWHDLYSERYTSAEKAIERHNYICSHIDEFVKEVS